MKRTITLILVLVIIVLVGASCLFAGTGAAIPATRTFTPKTNSYVKLTKGSVSIDVSRAAAIRNLCTADCTYTFNGTGAPWLVKANTPETIYIPIGVKSIVFSANSSAGTGIYNQTQ